MKICNLHRETAAKAHADTNHRYDPDGNNHPYVFHLDLCVSFCRIFDHLIPESDYFDVETGMYYHDVIEDARWTYNDVKKVSNINVAELAYALTNKKGKTRDERADGEYYAGIRECPFPYAIFNKICDRMANMYYSQKNGSSMHKKYINEYPHFKAELYTDEYKEMWDYIEANLM